MADEDFGLRTLDHLRIDRFRETAAYTYPQRRMSWKPLRDDYVAHGQALLDQLAAALPHIPTRDQDQRLAVEGVLPGALITVETLAPKTDRNGPVRVPAAFEMKSQDVVVLRTERLDDRTESAVVFVPDQARPQLQARIQAYGDARPRNREPEHRPAFEPVERFGEASARNLFASDVAFDDPEPVWWELWIREGREEAVRVLARAQGLDVHADVLAFPDVSVVFVLGDGAAVLAFLQRIPGAVAEARRAISTIEPFLERDPDRVGQVDFVAELAARITPPPADAPIVCVLDTGISGAHPLVSPGLAHAVAVDARWGVDDSHGHGTAMAGLALHGDLTARMADQGMAALTHWIETVKLLPPRGFEPHAIASYGSITQSAVSLIELERPNRARTLCLACSTDQVPSARPSAWSGAIDQLAAGAMSGERPAAASAAETPKRLMVVAAGNVDSADRAVIEAGCRIEDPAQAWNALTIGGVTAKVTLGADGDLRPLVAANTVSPYSADTVGMPSDLLPMKPEVLFEAGNMAVDARDFCGWNPALSLLTTGADVTNAPLEPFWATSAATGEAAAFLGRLEAALPGLWPETYRALTVHAARWPAPIRAAFVGRGAYWKTRSKAEIVRDLRRVGFGVPDLERAIRSAKNDFTVIAEAEIQPFAAGAENRGAVFNEVHFYDLPWPHDELRALDDKPVTLRVVLSYFVEPNLSGKAATRPETYRSFGLRFMLKKRTESDDEFRLRLSRARDEEALDEEAVDAPAAEAEAALEAEVAEKDAKEASRWLLGPKSIEAGSLHCDLWRGRASELADHDMIAVHPVTGWWKTHLGQNRRSDRGRYALVMSVSAEGLAVDLHSEVNAQVLEQEARLLLQLAAVV